MFTYFTERWKPLKGYEGLYSISDHGRVLSHEKIITYTNGQVHKYEEKILKLATISELGQALNKNTPNENIQGLFCEYKKKIPRVKGSEKSSDVQCSKT